MSHLTSPGAVHLDTQAATAAPITEKNNPAALNYREVRIHIKCSVATQVKAICLTVLTLGLILINKSYLDALAGRKIIHIYSNDTRDQISAKIGTMTPDEVKTKLKKILTQDLNALFGLVSRDSEKLQELRQSICELIEHPENARFNYTRDMVVDMDLEQLKGVILNMIDFMTKYIDQVSVPIAQKFLGDTLFSFFRKSS